MIETRNVDLSITVTIQINTELLDYEVIGGAEAQNGKKRGPMSEEHRAGSKCATSTTPIRPGVKR